MAISFGGEVKDPDAGARARQVGLLRTAIARLEAGQPKAALDNLHDAVFDIAEYNSIGLPY